MGKADSLSRHPDHASGRNDNEGVTMLPTHLFSRTTTLVTNEWTDRIKNCTDLDDTVTTALTTLLAANYNLAKHDLKDWEVIGGLVYWRQWAYVPRDAELCRDIVRAHHNSLAFGHPGQYKMEELVKQHFW